jgi:hypothetical protein
VRPLVVAGILLVILVAVLLFVYGSLRPCDMLAHDLRGAFRTFASRMASRPTSDELDPAARALGSALATAVADPIIEHVVSTMNPFECARLVVKLKVDPDGALHDVA